MRNILCDSCVADVLQDIRQTSEKALCGARPATAQSSHIWIRLTMCCVTPAMPRMARVAAQCSTQGGTSVQSSLAVATKATKSRTGLSRWPPARVALAYALIQPTRNNFHVPVSAGRIRPRTTCLFIFLYNFRYLAFKRHKAWHDYKSRTIFRDVSALASCIVYIWRYGIGAV